MEEITRFQQLRQAQSLAEEEKLKLGLPLYPDGDLSELAKKLRATNCDNDKYAATIRVYREEFQRKLLEDVDKINPLIRSLYDWLTFKAKPIKIKDFKEFVRKLKAPKQFDLASEWAIYADSLILAIDNKRISQNYCIDFQLLIRVCYIFKLCIKANAKGFEVPDKISEVILNEILRMAIILPAGVLNSRCCEDCSHRRSIEFPELPFSREPAERCKCPCDEKCKDPSSHCICIKTYVADLFVIKEELARYEEGDIADIENILAGEKKVRRHRTLLRSEDTSESEKQTDTFEERDHQVSEKFSLQSEVKNAVDSKVGIDAGVTATLKYGDSVTLTPHANVTANFSKSESENIARSYAKEITDRSVTKIQEKVRTLQISKIINELEERNKHSIDNTEAGADHRAGIFYWVNKVTHAQVFNYGRHMMFDVIVPEPAAMFKELFKRKIAIDQTKNEKPEKPIITPKSITRDTYGDFLNKYGIQATEELQPPNTSTCVQIAFSKSLTEPENDSISTAFDSNEFKSSQIPTGYKAVTMGYDVRCSTGNPLNTKGSHEAAVSVNVGNTCILNKSFNENNPDHPINPPKCAESE